MHSLFYKNNFLNVGNPKKLCILAIHITSASFEFRPRYLNMLKTRLDLIFLRTYEYHSACSANQWIWLTYINVTENVEPEDKI